MCFKALPWRPVPRFTGISEYTVDDQARVVKQVDYWDSINLVGGEVRGGETGEWVDRASDHFGHSCIAQHFAACVFVA